MLQKMLIKERRINKMAGIIFAYIGAVTRWLIGGMSQSINEYFIGKEDDNMASHISEATLNRIIGIIVFLIVIATVGFALED
jgi:hypothetical protein